MYTVYVIENNEGKRYKGVTLDLNRRLYQHNNDLSKWTKNRGPFKLIYKEGFENKTEALKREVFFKSGKEREYLEKLLKR